MNKPLTAAQEEEVKQLAQAIAAAATEEFEQLARTLVANADAPFGKRRKPLLETRGNVPLGKEANSAVDPIGPDHE